jgi:hypothetical protein
MGKDREGKFHPQKGKPSGSEKDEGIGLNPAHISRLNDYEKISEKYATDTGEDLANVRSRHPNRNVDKTEDHFQQKRQNPQDKKAQEETDLPFENLSSWSELSNELFAELANFNSDPCISIYLPTHHAGVEVNEQKDLINFKNELQSIGPQLKNRGVSTAIINRILRPAENLLKEDTFWHSQSSALCAFLADGYFKFVKLPYTVNQEIFINSSFVVTPLVPLIVNSKDYFFLLVLSKKQAKFYKVNPYGITYIPIKELPNGIDDVVHFEEKDDQKLFRTGSSGAGSGANYHGVGAGKPDEKENLAMYFDEVDETLWKEILHTEHAPLLLAGVDYLIPIYKQVSQYKNIQDEALIGSYEHEPLHPLFEKAREKMNSFFSKRGKQALESYRNHSATSLVSSQPSEIIPAAHYGRIAHLFVQPNEHIWGTFNETENHLELNDTARPGDECLLNKSIIKTMLTGGEVFFIKQEEMPAHTKMAALMRY